LTLHPLPHPFAAVLLYYLQHQHPKKQQRERTREEEEEGKRNNIKMKKKRTRCLRTCRVNWIPVEFLHDEQQDFLSHTHTPTPPSSN
jgi:hypothetical protein